LRLSLSARKVVGEKESSQSEEERNEFPLHRFKSPLIIWLLEETQDPANVAEYLFPDLRFARRRFLPRVLLGKVALAYTGIMIYDRS
jgi:hypothetical protein